MFVGEATLPKNIPVPEKDKINPYMHFKTLVTDFYKGKQFSFQLSLLQNRHFLLILETTYKNDGKKAFISYLFYSS